MKNKARNEKNSQTVKRIDTKFQEVYKEIDKIYQVVYKNYEEIIFYFARTNSEILKYYPVEEFNNNLIPTVIYTNKGEIKARIHYKYIYDLINFDNNNTFSSLTCSTITILYIFKFSSLLFRIRPF